MNPIEFALRRPYTIMVAMVALIAGGGLSAYRMKVDIFPALDLPVVYVCQPYSGMDPTQMEGLIANYYEYHFLYMNGIHHVESKNVQGVSLMKLYFHPGTDMAQAMAETVGYVNRARAFMPPGTVPPFIMRFDTGSVPVGYLTLKSKTKTIGEIQDQALFKVRPMFAAIPGVSAPPPFGGNQRTVVVRVNPDRMRSQNLSPDDVVKALSSGNLISPSGNIRTTTSMPLVPSNAMVIKPEELGNIPIKPNVYLRDLVLRDPRTDKPQIEDATDIPTGYALINGKRAVYILVTKRADASTLSVVNNVRAEIPKMQAQLPSDIEVGFEFDQSPYVTNSIKNVGFESGFAALLVGLMVLVFLRDWRSVIVVVLNIPLALVGSVVALALTGQSINLMTLGGLALAVGILVDEATVEVENIHTQMGRTDSMAVAVRRGNAETAVPRLLAMLCILAVFIPSFFMQGAARNLFVPLSLAVGFAMITSYLLSSTFVPVMSIWLLRKYQATHHETHSTPVVARSPDRATGPTEGLPQPVETFGPGGWHGQETVPQRRHGQETVPQRSSQQANPVARALGGMANLTTRWRWVVVPVYLVVALLATALLGLVLGREIFPQVDAGQFQFRLRGPEGTRIEQTEEITKEALDFIGKEVGPENVQITLGYVGVVPSSYPINSVYFWTGGPEEALMRVSLKRGTMRIEDLKRRLREKLQGHLQEWLARKWIAEGEPEDQVRERVKKLRLSFEPADIVNDVMSFGSPTPIEVAVSSSKMANNRAYAEKLHDRLAGVRSLRDLQYVQSLDYPTVEVQFDRERAAEARVTTEKFANSLVEATSSSRFTVPNYWRDPNTGIGYQVQVEVPQDLMRSAADLKTVPVQSNGKTPILVQNVADVREGTMPGEVDRYNMRRLVSMTANIEGEDLGHVAEKMALALQETNESLWEQGQDAQGKPGWKNAISGEFVPGAKRPTKPPAGLQIDVRGQVSPLNDMLRGLAFGLVVAVVVIFLLLTAYFQSIRLALTAVAAVPAVLCGVLLMLLATRTTLNLQSFMGAIMAVGVAVANAILLVTFAERIRQEGRSSLEAAVEGARTRLRPILMTSLAMIAGMAPMALGLGEGGDQTAPLGRAVIGGLLASTVATLTLLPAVFALFMGKSSTASVSLSPTDPQSRYFVPDFNEQL